MIPTQEKVIPVLAYTENDAHVIALYGVDEVCTIIEGAELSGECYDIREHLGIGCVVITDFFLTPMDVEIIKQILATYIGVIGLRAVSYLNGKALRTELSK